MQGVKRKSGLQSFRILHDNSDPNSMGNDKAIGCSYFSNAPTHRQGSRVALATVAMANVAAIL